MKTFLLTLSMTWILILPGYSQAKVTFAAPAGYKLKVVVSNQTQEEEQYVRFENLNAGDYTARITATTGGEVYTMQSNISLPANRETSYFIIVVNKTAQIHWTNETALASPPPPTTSYTNPSDKAYDSPYHTPRNQNYNGQPSYPQKGYEPNRPNSPLPEVVRCQCTNPFPAMTPLEASRLKAAVQKAPFDDDRMAIIQTALMRANLMTNDVQDLMRLLSFDNNRLTFAKRAYDRTCDKQNYYLLGSAFDFPSNARELQRYLQNVR